MIEVLGEGNAREATQASGVPRMGTREPRFGPRFWERAMRRRPLRRVACPGGRGQCAGGHSGEWRAQEGDAGTEGSTEVFWFFDRGLDRGFGRGRGAGGHSGEWCAQEGRGQCAGGHSGEWRAQEGDAGTEVLTEVLGDGDARETTQASGLPRTCRWTDLSTEVFWRTGGWRGRENWDARTGS